MTSLPANEAMFHMAAKVIQRSKGRSATAAAAYRAATTLQDVRTGRVFNFDRKKGVVEAFILTPDGAPAWTLDRAELWNRAEVAERRRDAVTAREVELSIPRDLPQERWSQFIRTVTNKYVTVGAVADVAIHAPRAADGDVQPHAHIMLSTRRLDPSTATGFAPFRNADLQSLFESGGRQGGTKGEALKAERARIAAIANDMLREVGSSRRVDSRSYAARGDPREPEPHVGETRMAAVRSRRTHDSRTALVHAIRQHRSVLAELQQVEMEMAQKKTGFPRLADGEARTDYKVGLLKRRFPDFDPQPYVDTLHMVDVRRSARTRILTNDGGWIEVSGKKVATWGTDGQAGPLARALADVIGAGDDGVVKLAKSAAVGHTAHSRPVRLSEFAVTTIADHWRERGYEDVTEAPDGAWIVVGEASRIRDTGDYASIHGSISDEAIRALVEKAADEWGATLESHGPEEFRERLWLECQRQGVDVRGYTPSAALRRRWEAEIAKRQSDEQLLAGVRRVATDADLLISAAAGDVDSLRKLDPDLRKFVSSYLDDDQRAELARQRPLDIVQEINGWRELGRSEPDPEQPEALGSVAKPKTAAESVPEQERRPT
jgi:hypothetical protein